MVTTRRRALPMVRPHLAPRAPLAMAVACALALGGCGTPPQATATLSEAIDGDSAFALVSAVDGSTVTLQVMDAASKVADLPADTGSTGGDAPAMPDGEGGEAPDETLPEEPGGLGEADPGDGGSSGSGGQPPQAPGGGGGRPGGVPPAKPGRDGDSAAGDGDAGTTDDSARPDGPSAPSDGLAAGADDDSTGEGGGQGGPGGTPPGGGQGGPGVPAGTEMTLTIPDAGIVYVESGGSEEQGSLSDIAEGAWLELTVEGGTTVTKVVVSEDGPAGMGGAGGLGRGSSTVNNGSGATTFTSDGETAGEAYASSAADENAVRVEEGAAVTLADATVTKTGDSTSSEDSDFYGLGAGVLAWDGASLSVAGGSVTTDAKGANGIFAYGEGTSATVSGTTIRTSAGNSGGIEVAGGATLTAENLDVDTQGESSAAIRSDRGGGIETVTGGSYVTHGKSSPAVYCTADVRVSDATLAAENSEGVVIEGKNSVALEGVDLTGNVNGSATRTGVTPNVMIYQSMSGDASVGTGNFSMDGGSFTAEHGTRFYVTNTDAVIELSGVDLRGAASDLLVVGGNDGVWGTAGANGGTVAMTATDQALAGAISVDEDSSLSLTLAGASSYAGTINADGQAGEVSVALEAGASWTLTGDAYVSELTGDTAGIDLAGHTLYVGGEAWGA